MRWNNWSRASVCQSVLENLHSTGLWALRFLNVFGACSQVFRSFLVMIVSDSLEGMWESSRFGADMN